ncbi:hypothetical protein OPT61_g8053 [Boeremia exigua]|uniref:Uncharacterized protein n=1 Tax=Boeremia exigua TaxID=749465 RepID=A0ACC2I0W0_9PLEO|nr:hypothetical protein OPT61_g8053 [Boeremia exigua]
MTSRETCVCTSSDGDSALSTTANVISILTFAYVLIIGGLYQVASYHRANYDYSGLRDRATKLRKEAEEIQALYRERAEKLPGAEAWDMTSEAVKTAINLSQDLEKAERRASSKWYLVWQEVTFRFVSNGEGDILGTLQDIQFANLKDRPEDLKRLRELMNQLHIFRVTMLKRLQTEQISGIPNIIRTFEDLKTMAVLKGRLTNLGIELRRRSEEPLIETVQTHTEQLSQLRRSKSLGALGSELSRHDNRTSTWPTSLNDNLDEARHSAHMTRLPPRGVRHRTAVQAVCRTGSGAGSTPTARSIHELDEVDVGDSSRQMQPEGSG